MTVQNIVGKKQKKNKRHSNTSDFSRVVETIPLYSTITNGVQGVAFDTSDNTIHTIDDDLRIGVPVKAKCMEFAICNL